jgi:hypothetical protein
VLFIDAEATPAGGGLEGVHEPQCSALVREQEGTAALEQDLPLAEAGLLVELHQGLVPWSGPRIEVAGDAVPEPPVVVDCGASPEERDAAVMFEDDGHDFA